VYLSAILLFLAIGALSLGHGAKIVFPESEFMGSDADTDKLRALLREIAELRIKLEEISQRPIDEKQAKLLEYVSMRLTQIVKDAALWGAGADPDRLPFQPHKK
jgi:hypothetical protein